MINGEITLGYRLLLDWRNCSFDHADPAHQAAVSIDERDSATVYCVPAIINGQLYYIFGDAEEVMSATLCRPKPLSGYPQSCLTYPK